MNTSNKQLTKANIIVDCWYLDCPSLLVGVEKEKDEPWTFPATPMAAAMPTWLLPISKTKYALRSMESPTRYMLLPTVLPVGAIP